ncbi:transposase [Roseibacillus ishigakijimensis]|uniref:Transposase n=1 Tax=Roseibacillus ishigakijimensis TaxID=454146 RepID=A0A934VNW3_9BACT|nr:transposase [Roseibacillus ishigakijimensis]MBK1835460.1 transposase [Roseibacillus ishigakijimensis]
MRRPRIKAPENHPAAYYHCVSRVVGREFLLGEAEKEQFVRYMRLYEKLYGLRVLSYVVMSNHFHVLVEVPQRPAEEKLPDEAGLVAHVRRCLGEGEATKLEWEFSLYREQGNTKAAEELREKWLSRMWDISRYMKVLKQRFTQWFNGRYNRRGTLWEDRFRSVLVEGKGAALKTMAAYIDLNPVRAGICDDPKDYRWGGYAEAVAGGKQARAALQWLNSFDVGMTGEARERVKGSGKEGGTSDWVVTCPPKEALERWRCYLFGVPYSPFEREEELGKEEIGGRARFFRRGLSREQALQVLSTGGRLKRSDYLRCRVRYLTDGAALGSRDFIETVFHSAREHFSPARKDGARPLKGLEVVPKPERIYNLRQLQKDVLT